MLRKRTAVILVFLASILYLAHAVIPHHHHNEQVCLGLVHPADHNNDKSCGNENNHDERNSSGADECIVDHGIILPSKQLNPNYHFQVISNHLKNFNCLFVSLRENRELNHDFSSTSINTVQLRDFFQTPVLEGAIGLRAPPSYFHV